MTPTRFAGRLRGVIAFAPTPFTDDDRVDLDGLAASWTTWRRHGGPVAVCGAVGEYAALDLDEYAAVMRVAADAVAGRVPLIVGIGHGDADRERPRGDGARAGAERDPRRSRLVRRARRRWPRRALSDAWRARPGSGSSCSRHAARRTAGPAAAARGARRRRRPEGRGRATCALFAEARERIGDRWAWINGMAELQAAEYAVLGADAFTSGLVNVAPELTRAVRARRWRRATGRRCAARGPHPSASRRSGRRRPGYGVAVIKEAMAMLGQRGGGACDRRSRRSRPRTASSSGTCSRSGRAGPGRLTSVVIEPDLRPGRHARPAHPPRDSSGTRSGTPTTLRLRRGSRSTRERDRRRDARRARRPCSTTESRDAVRAAPAARRRATR